MNGGGGQQSVGVIPVDQIAADDSLSADDLAEIVAHCKVVAAAADYRMLLAVNRIYEELEEDYQYRRTLADPFNPPPESRFGPNGLAQAAVQVGILLAKPISVARRLVSAGAALRYRLPHTGRALGRGDIDLESFLIAVTRTELVSPDLMTEVDDALAGEIASRAAMASSRFRAMVDAVVARVDADALRRSQARSERDRSISVSPDRFGWGGSRVSGTLPAVEGAVVDARLEAMARAIHTGDGRTHAQCRADALVALARGEQRLACGCENCATAQLLSAGAGARESDSAVAPVVSAQINIVTNLSTLVGLDEDPAWVDGQGLIDADTVRELLAGARRAFLAPSEPARNRYRPGAELARLSRAAGLCCSVPGCNAPAFTADLDHDKPFDHDNPDAGGATSRENLHPLCRFHHRWKTFARWVSRIDPMGRVIFESPTGRQFWGNAFTGMDLFPAMSHRPPPCKEPPRLPKLRDTKRRRNLALPPPPIDPLDNDDPPPF